MLPERLEVTAVLDPRPRYAGTSHDDATARAMGFRAALLPGVFVYGHATRLAVIGWGEAWLTRGTARARFRRPVYAGDTLVVASGPVERDEAGLIALVTVTNAATGEVVLDGSLGLPDRVAAPPADLPLRPTFAPRVAVAPGEVPLEQPLGSAETVLAEADVAESRADFHETEPVFAERRWVHSGCLIRKTMGDALGNLALPMPVIFTAVEVTTLAPVPIGAACRTSARITRAWHSKGRHYFETDEWLIADGRPVARHLRHNLYATDPT
jgi:acyl dehydratase